MADQSAVEDALVDTIVAALYPSGSNAVGVTGVNSRVYRGWPEAAALSADLAAGWANVTVYPEPSGMRNTTRHMPQWFISIPSAPTMTASASGNTASFAGTAAANQLAGLMVDGATYVYRTQATDTPAMVAANLAALARADRIVLLAGASIVIPGTYKLIARVVADQPAMLETRRQLQIFRISTWSADPATRDLVAATIDAALAQITFLPLPDGSVGQLLFRQGSVADRGENADLYRRDLLYSVEYPTILAQPLPEMLFGELALGAGIGVDVTIAT